MNLNFEKLFLTKLSQVLHDATGWTICEMGDTKYLKSNAIVVELNYTGTDGRRNPNTQNYSGHTLHINLQVVYHRVGPSAGAGMDVVGQVREALSRPYKPAFTPTEAFPYHIDNIKPGQSQYAPPNQQYTFDQWDMHYDITFQA